MFPRGGVVFLAKRNPSPSCRTGRQALWHHSERLAFSTRGEELLDIAERRQKSAPRTDRWVSVCSEGLGEPRHSESKKTISSLLILFAVTFVRMASPTIAWRCCSGGDSAVKVFGARRCHCMSRICSSA